MKKAITLLACIAALFGAAATPASAGAPSALTVTLTKTVGTTPGVCGTESTITVAPGTTVYYCYTLTNDSTMTAELHNLVDDQLGNLLESVEYNLLPGASVNTVALGITADAVITTTTTNTAVWEVCARVLIPSGRTAQGPVQFDCSGDMASATVMVQAPTTSTGPSSSTTTTTIQAAALTTPRYTG